MKYYKRLGLYKASNVSFNPSLVQAYSYDWWLFVTKIKGKIVFNDYRYSATTCRHQYKVKALLANLGINIDYVIDAPQGLQNLTSSINYYNYEIEKLENAINKKGSKKAKNQERKLIIKQLKAKINLVNKWIGA